MPGDSLWKLSKKYYGTGLKGDLIYKANKNKIRNKNILPVGKTLVIPNVAYHKASKIKEKKKILKDKREKTSSPKKVATKFKKFKLYKVQEDDSLSTISEDFYGTSRKWVYIWKANRRRLKNPNALVVGMVLRIPMDIK
ncbi:MAG: LysM peptidoglycan-binding domain-containing protein [Planctomycetota bacterium]|nr:MAG: LysM peptidoglycan-binding domain-containing protein [Planctomycetota bacterium]